MAHQSWAERGGGQGSRLMMTAFCCAVQAALEEADGAAKREELQRCAADVVEDVVAEPLSAEDGPHTGVKHAGYQDDQYFNGTLEAFERYEPHLLQALSRDGHELQPLKSTLWIPALDGVSEGALPARAREIWERYARASGGIVALGASSDGGNKTMLDRRGGVALQPVRERARKCLEVLEGVRELVRAQVHPHAFHAAWHIVTGSCAHAFDYDARLVEADRLRAVVEPVYSELQGVVDDIAGGLSDRARQRIKVQGNFGGCGLRMVALAPHAHAALWAASRVNAHKMEHVLRELGGTATEQAPKQEQAVEDAAKALLAAGIDVGGENPKLVASAREHFVSTPWQEDNPIDEVLQPRMPLPGDAAGRPKLAGALFAALDALQAATLWEEAPSTQQTIMLSAGGPGTGTLWSLRGLGERRAMQNGHFREALRLRLGDATAPQGAECQLRHRQHEDGCGPPCGQPLCEPTGECTHPLVCDAAAARLRPHRAVCTAHGRVLRSAGAEVDYERHVPHLYTWDASRRLHKEAILDVVSVWPGDSAMRCYDVTIASPHAARVNNPWRRPGVAARAGEARKETRYGSTVRPISMEVYGRIGPKSLHWLREAAREASLYGRSDCTAKQLLARWRGDMELALSFAQADAMLAARGALPHVAGPLYFPVGRMVRPSTAAGGERREQLQL